MEKTGDVHAGTSLVYSVERVVPASAGAEGRGLALAEWRGEVRDLGDDALKSLWGETLEYTRREIGMYSYWRRLEEPSLPGGYSAEGITQNAFERLLEPDGVQKVYSTEEIRTGLRKLVKQRVWQLHERSEAGRLVSEWDVLPHGQDGEPQSIFDLIPGQIPKPDVELMRKEKAELLEKLKEGFSASLGTDEELRGVFVGAWDGEKRQELAEKLGVQPELVKNLQRKVGRRLADFCAKAQGGVAEVLQEIRGGEEEGGSEEHGHIERTE